MFTLDEAVEFLTTVLKIEDVVTKLKTHRGLLLQEFTAAFREFVPYQNLVVTLVKPEERRIPTAREILNDKEKGGVCYSLTLTSHWLLLALGYKSSLVLCKYLPATTNKKIHLAQMVYTVEKEGDDYHIDVGMSLPSLQPVPMRDLPATYEDFFHRYRLELEDNNKLLVRHHWTPLSDAFGFGEGRKFEWQRVLEIRLTPIQEDDERLKYHFEPVFTEPKFANMFYLTELRVTLYKKEKAIIFAGNRLKIWDKGNFSVPELVRSFDNDEELKDAIEFYCPALKNVSIIKALQLMRENSK